MKQFLLSLLATTISIALTFGTAAIIDYNKEQNEKHEIVMMVMYDMYNSLISIEQSDSMIHRAMAFQQQIADDTSQFEQLRFKMLVNSPKVEYTETTERIFSSSIETINTVGNVLFTEMVAEFYQSRQIYKTMVCDSVAHEIAQNKTFQTLGGTLDLEYSFYAILSHGTLNTMRHLYTQCQQMMQVSDEQIAAYRKEREQMESGKSQEEDNDSIIFEIIQLQQKIDQSKAQLQL